MLRIALLSACLALCSLHAASGQRNDGYQTRQREVLDQSSQQREPVDFGQLNVGNQYSQHELDQSSQQREPVEFGQQNVGNQYRPHELDQSSQQREPLEPIRENGGESVGQTSRPRQNGGDSVGQTSRPRQNEPGRNPGSSGSVWTQPPSPNRQPQNSASQYGQPSQPTSADANPPRCEVIQPITTPLSSDRHLPQTGGSCDHCPCDCSATSPLASSGFATGGRPDVPTGGRPDVPTGGRPGYATGGRPDVPTGGSPDVATGGRPDVPTGGRPDVPTGGRPGYATGGRPGYATGGRPNVATGGRPDVATGGRPGYATGERPEVTTVENPEDNAIDSPANQLRAKSLSQGLTFFANNVYKSLGRQQTGNVFFSPLSIHAVLAMASVGASGVTLDQLKTGLSLPEDEKTTTHGYRHLIKDLNSMTDNGMTVKVANKIFVNQRVTVKQSYKDVTRESFHSELESIDFRQTYTARNTINKWVEDNTNNKIKNIIPIGALSPNMAMVLVNAMYFKGTWKVKFDAEETRKRDFYVTPVKTVEVDMMHASGDFHISFNRALDSKILEMFYNNGKISMVIVLPVKLDGLAALESKLTPELISQLRTTEGEVVDTSVYLPKFTLEESVQLNEILREMGMVDLFDYSANFSRIAKSGVNVGQVSHKSFIEINEEGTEAAVATVFTVSLSYNGGHNPIPFNADHPFLFLVRHVELNQILFMGRYKNPPTQYSAPSRQGIKNG